MDCYFVGCGKVVAVGLGRTTKSPAINTNSAEANPKPRIAATTGIAQNQPWRIRWPRYSAREAPAIPPNPPKIRVNRESSRGAWHAGQLNSYECATASVQGILTKHNGHFRFHMAFCASSLCLSLQVGKYGFCRPAAAGKCAVDRGIVAMVAASVDPRTDSDRALRRFKRAGVLLRLGVCDAVTL